jgi:hypothetical protein
MSEVITHRKVPPEVTERLKLAGGLNPFGEPMFRVVWGWDRVVPNHGLYKEMTVRVDSQREITLPTNIVETRMEPKYLPASCWHLEMWRPPSDYGTPETWGKLGQEIVGDLTVDTSGPFPHRGEYELCYPLTSDLTETGAFIGLNGTTAELLVNAIKASNQQRLSMLQREAAIRQRLIRERNARIARTEASLLDARPAFYDQPTSFPSGPKSHKIITGN